MKKYVTNLICRFKKILIFLAISAVLCVTAEAKRVVGYVAGLGAVKKSSSRLSPDDAGPGGHVVQTPQEVVSEHVEHDWGVLGVVVVEVLPGDLLGQSSY